MTADENVKLFGTSHAPDSLRPVRLGPLTFLYSSDAIRRICWHGTELVRAVAWPVRDENWGTFAPHVIEEELVADDVTCHGHLKFSVGGGRLECALNIRATSEGEVSLDLTMKPIDGPFATNRAGFTVLHPIKGMAGTPLQVTHSDGSVEPTVFPRLIAPAQPVLDIQGLAYGLDGKTLDIAFEGDVFEMEDQRNWSDASYKTYCVPLVFPFTYEFDSPKSQSIRVSLAGEKQRDGGAQAELALTWKPTDAFAPCIGLAVEPGWLSDEDVIAQSGVGHIAARIEPDATDQDLRRIAEAAKGLELDLELVIANENDPAAALATARDKIKDAGLVPTRIIALRESYLSSHQPSGPWPEGPDPTEVVAAARVTFPDAAIGGGMLTNFTEFNRCRPDPEACDFVTHGSSAIVHAGDDLSVCETLEALPQVFESARGLAADKAYRLGLVSIGMRSNPYGAAVAENPAQVRRTMARDDPRQRGLFAAAWAVGVLAATEDHHIDSLCLAAPGGPFGVGSGRQPYPQPYYDETPDAALFPVFHVVKAAAAMAGRVRLRLSGLPEEVHGYGVATEEGADVMLANATPVDRTLRLCRPGRVAVLDGTTFTEATRQADWLEVAKRRDVTTLTLTPFAIAFVEN